MCVTVHCMCVCGHMRACNTDCWLYVVFLQISWCMDVHNTGSQLILQLYILNKSLMLISISVKGVTSPLGDFKATGENKGDEKLAHFLIELLNKLAFNDKLFLIFQSFYLDLLPNE